MAMYEMDDLILGVLSTDTDAELGEDRRKLISRRSWTDRRRGVGGVAIKRERRDGHERREPGDRRLADQVACLPEIAPSPNWPGVLELADRFEMPPGGTVRPKPAPRPVAAEPVPVGE